ncbi:transporter [Haladaptatus sp. CMSO5]|uniref:transporter n=1 Tax=Haladaptatus sp. CMSO5 TaxID=3120514 RepID=UPI002FCE24D4
MAQQNSIPVVRGTLAGLAAYLFGYLVTYLLAAPRIDDLFAVQAFEFFTGENPVWKLTGWLFYNEHFVSTIVPRLTGSDMVNFLVESDDGSATLLFFLPVLLLVGAGALAARSQSDTSTSSSAKAGATVVLGYVLPALVGAQLFRLDLGNSTAGPDFITAILVAGLLYPLIFGALGGVLVSFYSSRQTSSPQ